MARLGDYIEQIRGVSYKPTDLRDFQDENSVLLLRANNIQDGNLNLDDVIYVSKNKIAEKQYLKKGDILICTSSGSKELVGKAAYVKQDIPISFGAFCKVVRPKTECKKYIGHFFQSPYYRRSISDLSAGANINNIRNEHIGDLEIQLPSLEEQRRIAALLDKVSDLIAKRRAQLDKLDLLVKARFVEMFERGNYPKVKVSEICDFITKGTTPPAEEIFKENSPSRIPFLKVYNLSFTGELLFEQNPQYIERNVHEGKLSRSKVYPNDVLMNIVGPPLGKFALIPPKYGNLNINQALAIFRAKEKILPKFLLAALMQPEVLKPFMDQAVGVRQQNLSLEQCRNLEISLPDVELQKQFVKFVEQVEKSKLTIQQSLDKLEILKKALMQQYFG